MIRSFFWGTMVFIGFIYSQEPVFIEKNGLVVIEAESVPMGENWRFRSGNFLLGGKHSIMGYTGQGAYHFVGNSETNGPVNSPMEYKIKISNPGKYRFFMRGMEAPIESGKGDRANDCYIKMEGQDGCEGKFTKFVRLGSSFQWTWKIRLECSHHTFSDPIYDLNEGVHTFSVAGRSKNFLFDRMAFVLQGSDHDHEDLLLPQSDVNGSIVEHPDTAAEIKPVKILSPTEDAELVMGQKIELKGEGNHLTWFYDANSDGKSEIFIGEGNSVPFDVPKGVSEPKEIFLILEGTAGRAQIKLKLLEDSANLINTYLGDSHRRQKNSVYRGGGYSINGRKQKGSTFMVLDFLSRQKKPAQIQP